MFFFFFTKINSGKDSYHGFFFVLNYYHSCNKVNDIKLFFFGEFINVGN
jgi:hypothetical protein